MAVERIRVYDRELHRRMTIVASRFDPKIYDRVDAPATNPDGSPLPPEFDVRAPKKATKSAAKKAAPRRPSNASATPKPVVASDQSGQSAADEGDS